MITIAIENVLFAGSYGGAVFSGTCAEGHRHRMVASYEVMPRPPIVGEVWRVKGTIQDHPMYGRQIITTKAILECPSGRLIRETIAKSKAFPGIGEKLADQLWRRFGEDLYLMLNAANPEPFEAPLRSKELARILVNGWRELALLSDAYKWLDRHGAPVALAQRIISVYQEDTIDKLEENVFRLLAFTNFETADRIARALGVGLEDEIRLVAAADAAVVRRLDGKHTWATEADFRSTIKEIIKCNGETAGRAINLAIQDNAMIRVGGGLQGLGPASMEEYIATMLMTMAAGNFQPIQLTLRQQADDNFVESFLRDFNARSEFPLSHGQQDAVMMGINEPVSIIGGGAGVGKTTALKAVCDATEMLGGHVYMLALSGRAARRMSEATGRRAMTIASFVHRVDRGEIVLAGEPTIAIDEASMLDLPTTYRLLRRLEPGCRLLLLGDPGQLPPISFGIIFHILVETKAVPMVELTEIHRQAAATGIPQASMTIRGGVVPELKAYTGLGSGIHFIDCPREAIPEKLAELMKNFGGFDDARILTPVKNGVGGTRETNRFFHNLHISDNKPELAGFAEGEPVIWTENDYELELMNGSLGKVVKTDHSLIVEWDGENKTIDNTKNMDYAYAITIHKSQGSQFKRVIIPVFDCKLLDRAMLYTAITRAEQQVVLIGDRKTFEKAIKDPPSTTNRKTGFHFALDKAKNLFPPSTSNRETGFHFAVDKAKNLFRRICGSR